MSLIRSLNTAVSGLKAQQFRIEVVGNNIANVDTTAFKASRTDFSTILGQAVTYGMAPQGNMGGIDPLRVGLGVQVASTPSDFSQGPTKLTGVSSDLAIVGDGFFIMKTPSGGQVYTRDGSLAVNAANLLHDPATGLLVQGYGVDEGFQVRTQAVLQNLEIPVGVMTIAEATSRVSFEGNLNASGAVATQGTLRMSDNLFDDRYTNDDLISSDNPLGLARATADTPLANLVRSLGDYVSFSSTSCGTAGTAAYVFPELQTTTTGLMLQATIEKGSRTLPARSFFIGDPPPQGGMTLGELVSFLQGTAGVADGLLDGEEEIEQTYSYARTNPVTGETIDGTISYGTSGGLDDSASLSSITDRQADFTGVRVGDYIRFTSGQAAGEIAEITGISASTPGGALDTLTLRTDGFNSLSMVPAMGDTYVVHAPAGIRMAEDTTLAVIDGGSASVTVGGVTVSGDLRTFTVTDTGVSSFPVDRGVCTGMMVRYTSGGAEVLGRVVSVADSSITVGFDGTLALTPDAGTDFAILDPADGAIEVAGNVGAENDIGSIELLAGDRRLALFDQAPVIEAAGESFTTSLVAYDSLGTARDLQVTYVYQSAKGNGPNVYRYFVESPDDADGDRIVGSGMIFFSADGQYLATGLNSEYASIDLSETDSGGSGVATPLLIEFDFSRLSQFAAESSEVQLRDQDGFAAGTLREFAVGADGTITGVFDNGLTRTLGQVALARFANPNGLVPVAENVYEIAPNTGTPLVGTPGSFGRGVIRGGYLEESNVDLAEEFTDLVVGQRAFQASARTVSVSDELLQELVNLI
ncbi:MAG: flagellar hook-basal body complex protein [Planctomycetes bacterium]|nr:flagellar hook-basal body complex protein [Planctomycetota bacterium]